MRIFKTYEFKKSLLSGTGLMVVLPLVILVNVLFSFLNLRLDATQGKIYSISEGSRHTLSRLSEKVTVKYYWSRSEPDFPRNLRIYAGQVSDYLAELEHAGKGKIVVEQYDPKPDSDEEEMAQKYALRPIKSAQGPADYCGLVFLAGDREERIALLDPGRQELLEFDIMHIICQLQAPSKKVLGIISDLPVFGNPQAEEPVPPWSFVQELKKSYEIKEIRQDSEKIDPDVNLLLIVHPKKFSPKLQFAVDQYVLGGGNLFAFVDPFCMSDSSLGQLSPPISAIPELFKAWGISSNPTRVVVDFGQSTAIRGGDGKREDNPLFLSITPETLNRNNVVTSKLEVMLLGLSGYMEKAPDSPYDFEPLIFSTEKAGLVQPIELNKPVSELRKDVTPTGVKYVLAVEVRGTFKTAFPDGPPKPEPVMGGPPPDAQAPANIPPRDYLREGKAKSTIIVVADADMLADPFYVEQNKDQGYTVSRMFNDNFNFIANACELLTGDDDLISLRTRGKFQRPFTRVIALQRIAQDRWLAREQELARQGEELDLKQHVVQQSKDESQRQIMSKEQEDQVRQFQEEKRKIDRELKEVRRQLNANISTMGNRVKALNIFFIPLCVGLAGIGYAFFKQRRMKNR